MAEKEKIDVLVLDDDQDLCMLMESILKMDQYRVHSCRNAGMFETLLGSVEPTMIIMDMLLAGKDGRDLCRKLKADAATQSIIVMMVSAHPDADQSCRAAGADYFLRKPFDINDFKAKVAECVSRQN